MWPSFSGQPFSGQFFTTLTLLRLLSCHFQPKVLSFVWEGETTQPSFASFTLAHTVASIVELFNSTGSLTHIMIFFSLSHACSFHQSLYFISFSRVPSLRVLSLSHRYQHQQLPLPHRPATYLLVRPPQSPVVARLKSLVRPLAHAPEVVITLSAVLHLRGK